MNTCKATYARELATKARSCAKCGKVELVHPLDSTKHCLCCLPTLRTTCVSLLAHRLVRA